MEQIRDKMKDMEMADKIIHKTNTKDEFNEVARLKDLVKEMEQRQIQRDEMIHTLVQEK